MNDRDRVATALLAACFALYYLRDLDTKWPIGGHVSGGR